MGIRAVSAIHLVLILTTVVVAEDVPQFERDIAPLLARSCHGCHSGDTPEGELDLTSLQGLARGGSSGRVVERNKPNQSYLFHLVKRGEMPPKDEQKLSDAEVALIERWIAGGLSAMTPFPEIPPATLVSDEDRDHWAYRNLDRIRPPQNNSRTAIDAFIDARLKQRGLASAPPADRETLLRRATLDLTGVPPTPEERRLFLNDESPDAFAKVVDRLLASPRFGQRWGRHWLDLTGYADTVGFDANQNHLILSENKWKYRDYVIRAWNQGTPFDTFLQQQLAGDELVDWKTSESYTPELRESLIATGFLRTARDQTHEPESVNSDNMYEVIHDTVEIVTASLMGLTVKCARCHDHKFDAIPQQDYYRIMAVFMTAYNPDDWRPVFPWKPGIDDRVLPDVSPNRQTEIRAHNEQLDQQVQQRRKQQETLRAAARGRIVEGRLDRVPAPQRAAVLQIAQHVGEKTEAQEALAKQFSDVLSISDDELTAALSEDDQKHVSELESEVAELEKGRQAWGKIQALYDVGRPPTTFLLKRGQYEMPGRPVAPGVLSVLGDERIPVQLSATEARNGSSGRRLAFARRLTTPGNRASALVARVFVNRVWQHLFGAGLVGTAGNFGVQGTPPTHPRLLDYLAREFQVGGWKSKSLIRRIMLTRVYQQSSAPRLATADETNRAQTVDPSNALLWHARLRRLESEAVRDSLLAVTGQLNNQLGGSPIVLKGAPNGRVAIDKDQLAHPADAFRRSVYLVNRRGYHHSLLTVFDQPAIQTTCSVRQFSAVPLQSLSMLNDELLFEAAAKLRQRITGGSDDLGDQIRHAFVVVFGREPDSVEQQMSQDLIRDQEARFAPSADGGDAAEFALDQLCRMLLNASEFLYVE